MKIQIFTVYDEKAKAYLPPFFMNQEGQARRTFGDCINSDKHNFGQHPSDYTLFCLGTFEDDDATHQLKSAPQSLGNGVEFIELTSQGAENAQVSDEIEVPRHSQGGNSPQFI